MNVNAFYNYEELGLMRKLKEFILLFFCVIHVHTVVCYSYDMREDTLNIHIKRGFLTETLKFINWCIYFIEG